MNTLVPPETGQFNFGFLINRTYLEQNYGELKLIYYIDEPHGSMHRCAAVVRFRDCNVANHVKQRYDGITLAHVVRTTVGRSEGLGKVGGGQ